MTMGILKRITFFICLLFFLPLCASANQDISVRINGIRIEPGETVEVRGGEILSLTAGTDVQCIEYRELLDDSVIYETDAEDADTFEYELYDGFPGGTMITAEVSAVSLDGERTTIRFHYAYRTFSEFTFEDSVWGKMLVSYEGNETAVLVPSEYEGAPVQVIGERAFAGNRAVAEVILPDTIEYIKKEAFYDSTLSSIVLPESLRSIEEGAFQGTYLSEVRIPAGITGIEPRTFSGASFLESVQLPEGVVTIGDQAFEDCAGLKEIVLPDDVHTIGEAAFRLCNGLERVSLSRGLRSIMDNAFQGCDSLGNVTFPQSLEYIGTGAFANCGRISINIPESLREISGNPFYGTDADLSISGNHPVFTSDQDGILYNRVFNIAIGSVKPSVNEVTISDGTQKIADYAFAYSELEAIELPDSVEYIGDSSFCGTRINGISLPEGIRYIGEYAFMGCDNLREAVLPDTVSYLGEGAFAACTMLETIQLSEHLSAIRESTFFACSALKHIMIPASVSVLEPYALQGCSSLEAISIGGQIEFIGKNAFPAAAGSLKVYDVGNRNVEAYCSEYGIEYIAGKEDGR